MVYKEKQPCEICGRWDYLEEHHVFGGYRRKISDELSAVIHICHACHMDIHHSSPAKYKWLFPHVQAQVMERTGMSVEEWIARFGRNYL